MWGVGLELLLLYMGAFPEQIRAFLGGVLFK